MWSREFDVINAYASRPASLTMMRADQIKARKIDRLKTQREAERRAFEAEVSETANSGIKWVMEKLVKALAPKKTHLA